MSALGHYTRQRAQPLTESLTEGLVMRRLVDTKSQSSQQKQQTSKNLWSKICVSCALLALVFGALAAQTQVDAKTHHSKRQVAVADAAMASQQQQQQSQPSGRENTNWWNLWWQQYINEAMSSELQPTVRPIVSVSFNGQTISLPQQELDTNEDQFARSEREPQLLGVAGLGDIERAEKLRLVATSEPSGGRRSQPPLAGDNWNSARPIQVQVQRARQTRMEAQQAPENGAPDEANQLGIQMRAGPNPKSRQQQQQQLSHEEQLELMQQQQQQHQMNDYGELDTELDVNQQDLNSPQAPAVDSSSSGMMMPEKRPTVSTTGGESPSGGGATGGSTTSTAGTARNDNVTGRAKPSASSASAPSVSATSTSTVPSTTLSPSSQRTAPTRTTPMPTSAGSSQPASSTGGSSSSATSATSSTGISSSTTASVTRASELQPTTSTPRVNMAETPISSSAEPSRQQPDSPRVELMNGRPSGGARANQPSGTTTSARLPTRPAPNMSASSTTVSGETPTTSVSPTPRPTTATGRDGTTSTVAPSSATGAPRATTNDTTPSANSSTSGNQDNNNNSSSEDDDDDEENENESPAPGANNATGSGESESSDDDDSSESDDNDEGEQGPTTPTGSNNVTSTSTSPSDSRQTSAGTTGSGSASTSRADLSDSKKANLSQQERGPEDSPARMVTTQQPMLTTIDIERLPTRPSGASDASRTTAAVVTTSSPASATTTTAAAAAATTTTTTTTTTNPATGSSEASMIKQDQTNQLERLRQQEGATSSPAPSTKPKQQTQRQRVVMMMPGETMRSTGASMVTLDGETPITMPMEALMRMMMLGETTGSTLQGQRQTSVMTTAPVTSRAQTMSSVSGAITDQGSLATTTTASLSQDSSGQGQQPTSTAAPVQMTNGQQAISTSTAQPSMMTSSRLDKLTFGQTIGEQSTTQTAGFGQQQQTSKKNLLPPPTTRLPTSSPSPSSGSARLDSSASLGDQTGTTTSVTTQPDNGSSLIPATGDGTTRGDPAGSDALAAAVDAMLMMGEKTNGEEQTSVTGDSRESKIEMLNMDLVPIQRLMGSTPVMPSRTVTGFVQPQQAPANQMQMQMQMQAQRQAQLQRMQLQLQQPVDIVSGGVEPGMRLRPPPSTAVMQQSRGPQIGELATTTAAMQRPTSRPAAPSLMSSSGAITNGMTISLPANQNDNTVYMIMLGAGQTSAMPPQTSPRQQTTQTSKTSTSSSRAQQQAGSTSPASMGMATETTRRQQANPTTTTTRAQQQNRLMTTVAMRPSNLESATTTTTSTTTRPTTGGGLAKDHKMLGKLQLDSQTTSAEQAPQTSTTMIPMRASSTTTEAKPASMPSVNLEREGPSSMTASQQPTATVSTTLSPPSSSASPFELQQNQVAPQNQDRPKQQGVKTKDQQVTATAERQPAPQQNSVQTSTKGGSKGGDQARFSASSGQQFIPAKLRTDFSTKTKAQSAPAAAQRTPAAVAPKQEQVTAKLRVESGAPETPSTTTQPPAGAVQSMQAIRQFGGANRMSALANGQPVAFGRPATMMMVMSGGNGPSSAAGGAPLATRRPNKVELPSFEYGPAIAVRRPDEPLTNGQMPNCTLTGKNFCVLTKDYPMNEVRQAVERSFRSVRIMYEELQTVSDQELHKENFVNATSSQAASGKFACQTQVEMMQPGWAKDEITKDWMLVVNTDVFPQRVRTESCAQPNTPCEFISPFYDSTCQQRYSLHRMIAIDPHDPSRSPQVAVFKFPAGCVCRVHPIRKSGGQAISLHLEDRPKREN